MKVWGVMARRIGLERRGRTKPIRRAITPQTFINSGSDTMPFPAARLGDLTAHGGAIAGPGCPTVLIGGQPAARVGDLQVCPMFTGPVPHVGGPIVGPGSPLVLIGGLPAARVGDLTQCAGPPGAIAPPGCPTVLIGP